MIVENFFFFLSLETNTRACRDVSSTFFINFIIFKENSEKKKRRISVYH